MRRVGKMGRKPTLVSSPKYGALIISFLFRYSDFIGELDREPSAQTAETLDKMLAEVFIIPEIQEHLKITLDYVSSCSTREWEKGIRKLIRIISDLLSDLWIEKEGQDPFADMSMQDIIDYLLCESGWKGSFKELVVISKTKIIEILQRIVLDKPEEPNKWAAETIKGAFSDDPENATKIIRLSLLTWGGEKLLQEVDDAVKIVIEKLHSSSEFETAVLLGEKRCGWGGSESDTSFQKTWEDMRQNIKKRIIGKDLSIPGPHLVDERNKIIWDVEEAVAMETIYYELSNRVAQNPLKLITDAWRGSLKASIVLAAENDLLDEIKYDTAAKRDIRKSDFLSDNKVAQDSVLLNEPQFYSENLSDIDNRVLMNSLNEVEKEIVNLMAKGYGGKDIAVKFAMSPSWVSKKKEIIKAKLKTFRKEHFNNQLKKQEKLKKYDQKSAFYNPK
jgi:DNA-binding CsgD family transcriptional regulator